MKSQLKSFRNGLLWFLLQFHCNTCPSTSPLYELFNSFTKTFLSYHQTPTKKPWWSFFGKVLGLQHTDFLKWNTLFSEIAIIWNNWDKILSESFDNFSTNGLHIVIGVIIRNGKIFHLLYIFLSPRLSYALFVYLIFHYIIS